MPTKFDRRELMAKPRTSEGPPRVGAARRTCGKCNAVHPATGSGGKVHRILGWIGPCCVVKPKDAPPSE